MFGLKSGLALAAVAALAIVLAVSYEKKWLNKWLPTKWQKEGYGACPGNGRATYYPGIGLQCVVPDPVLH